MISVTFSANQIWSAVGTTALQYSHYRHSTPLDQQLDLYLPPKQTNSQRHKDNAVNIAALDATLRNRKYSPII